MPFYMHDFQCFSSILELELKIVLVQPFLFSSKNYNSITICLKNWKLLNKRSTSINSFTVPILAR